MREINNRDREGGAPGVGDGDNALSLVFPNGSRIVALPGTETTVRGFSAVSLLLIDDASRVVEGVRRVVRYPGLWGDSAVAMDATGVGQPIVKMLPVGAGLRLKRCDDHGRRSAAGDGADGHSDPFQRAEVRPDCGRAGVIERGYLRLPAQMPALGSLMWELKDMQAEVRQSGAVQMGASGAGQHDALVIALAPACWRAGRAQPGIFGTKQTI